MCISHLKNKHDDNLAIDTESINFLDNPTNEEHNGARNDSTASNYSSYYYHYYWREYYDCVDLYNFYDCNTSDDDDYHTSDEEGDPGWPASNDNHNQDTDLDECALICYESDNIFQSTDEEDN